ncbi:MAG: heavy-metal-associated domain-containing protein [Acidimicrobiales bacterium]
MTSAPSSPSSPSSPSADVAGTDGASATLTIDGMHCGSCVALVEETLTEQDGVSAASVDLESGRAEVRYDPSRVTLDDLTAAVAEAGYSATPAG